VEPGDVCQERCHRIDKCREIPASERIHVHSRLYAAPGATHDPRDNKNTTYKNQNQTSYFWAVFVFTYFTAQQVNIFIHW